MYKPEKLIFTILLIFISTSCSATQAISSFPIPAAINFAGNTISLERYDMRERFDREQIVIAYSHSSSILVIKRANLLFPVIEPILKANGIPDDFKYLAVIESYLDPRAYSPTQAAGIWQLMPKTAQQFGLEVSDEIDERYHIEKATEAACKYLKSAYNKYGSWTTVAISYNAGMGRISSELEKQNVTEAYDLLLTSESSRYLFRILAMKQFLENPAEFGFRIHKDHFYHKINTTPVEITDSVGNWTSWAAKYKLTYAELKDFNVWLRDRKLTNKDKKTYIINVPDKNDLNYKPSKVKILSSFILGN
ncbi:MAG: lytic transglycosylase domain-containing protein [Paludibacter sp.]|nr:lytic transglycosylase domain-containing protein [Paludibacter sp.]